MSCTKEDMKMRRAFLLRHYIDSISCCDKIYKTATGTYTADSLRQLVGGAAAVLSGGLLAVRQKIDNKSDYMK